MGQTITSRDDLDVAIFRAEGEKDSVNIRIIERLIVCPLTRNYKVVICFISHIYRKHFFSLVLINCALSFEYCVCNARFQWETICAGSAEIENTPVRVTAGVAGAHGSSVRCARVNFQVCHGRADFSQRKVLSHEYYPMGDVIFHI